ncbi:MAG: pyridoxal phosphate-dependent aminotransferase [Bryobacterales bacterium]|nr:pyridoxal phosphate-dependent aminotransferase [Bryobacterales bacterium]
MQPDAAALTQPVRYSSRLQWESAENPLAAMRRQLEGEGREVLDLTGSNPTGCGLGDWGDAIAAALATPGSARYRPLAQGLPRSREAVAAHYAALGVEVDPGRLMLTASTSESYSLLFQLLCDAGDEVLAPTPGYPLFEHLAGLAGVRLRTYGLRYAGEWMVDFAALEAALHPRTRAVLVVNPNNPTGGYLRQWELDRLLALCAARGLALIGDEVFWEYPLEARGERTCLAAEVQSPALLFSLGGLSKSAGMPQMKVGWMLARGPQAECQRALERLRWIADTYLSVSTPAQEALPDLLRVGSEIRAQIQQRLRTNLALVRRWARRGRLVSALPVEGGWSVILRLPAAMDDQEWCRWLLGNAHVWVQPGYFYDLPGGPYVVLSLLTPPDALDAGLGRISKVVEECAG